MENWEQIAQRDPFLAGVIAAAGWLPWMEETAESTADTAGLTGEARARFLNGWHTAMEDDEAQRKADLEKYLDEMQRQAAKGDPAR